MGRGPARAARRSPVRGGRGDILRNAIPETAIVRNVLHYLKLRGVYAWRNNTGASHVPAEGGRRARFIRYGMVGSSDILGILPDGRFIAVECKAEKGRLSPPQADFLKEILARGGVAGMVRSIEEAEALLGEA